MDQIHLPKGTVDIVQVSIPGAQNLLDSSNDDSLLNVATLSTSQLCDFCFSIPFKYIGFHESFQKEDFLRRLGHNKERPFPEVLKNKDSCFFCQKLLLLFRDWAARHCHNLPFSRLGRITVEIIPHWLPTVEKDTEGHPKGWLLRLGAEFMLWDFTPEGDEGNHHSPNFVFQRYSKPSLSVADFLDAAKTKEWLADKTKAYSGRARPLLADMRIFRKWKEFCKLQHQATCGVGMMSESLERIRVIDVEDRCIVEDIQGQEYVALSYVWGTAKMLKLKGKNLEHYRRPGTLASENLPATIADAIEVTRGAGERYLWVDSLCIIQDDEADKRYFIPRMDSVYAIAVFTIIALSGNTADSGLPGVRPGSRSRIEEPFTIRTHALITSLDPVRMRSWDNYMGESPWDRRAWTLQEKIFSRRMLVFTPEQIYWECQRGSYCEEGIWEVEGSPHMYRRAFGNTSFQLPRPEQGDWKHHLSNLYRNSVENYTLRKLTYASDALNAFAGILRALQRSWVNEFFWALPVPYFSSALQWKTGRVLDITIRECHVGFKDGRDVLHSVPIPSWSWVAWETRTSLANFDPLGMAPEVVFHRMDYSGQLSEILESDEQPVRVDENTHRRAWKNASPTAIVASDLPSAVRDHPARLTFLYFWTSSALLPIIWFTGFKKDLRPVLGTVERPIRFSWMQIPDPSAAITNSVEDFGPAEMICSERREFVVIGRDTHTHVGGCADMLMLVVLERRDFVVYRRGLLSVAEEDWVAVAPKWNAYILG